VFWPYLNIKSRSIVRRLECGASSELLCFEVILTIDTQSESDCVQRSSDQPQKSPHVLQHTGFRIKN